MSSISETKTEPHETKSEENSEKPSETMNPAIVENKSDVSHKPEGAITPETPLACCRVPSPPIPPEPIACIMLPPLPCIMPIPNKEVEPTIKVDMPKQPELAKHDSSILDLAFIMDCTGSMGSYIQSATEVIILELNNFNTFL